jgi:predicted CoA-binding protein
VNPEITEALGLASHRDLAAVPPPIEVVNIFRRAEHIGEIVDGAIRLGARAIWMQRGLVDEAAAGRARAAGLLVVMDRCIMVEHSRHIGNGPAGNTGMRTAK